MVRGSWLRGGAVLLALLLAGPLSARAEDEDHGDVLVLTDSNFDKIVNNEKIMAVEFYAPWCGHCKSLAPAWKAAASSLVEHGIKLAKVDATVQTSVAGRFSIQGYPTIKIFRNGKDSEYKGPRDAEGIASYMVDQAVPGARKVSASELERLRGALREEAPESLVVLFAAKESDVEGTTGLMGSQSKLGGVFLALAERLRESFSFAWSADPEAAAQAGVKPGTLAVLHSPLLAGGKLEPAVAAYSGAADGDAAESWLWKASLPLVGELTTRTQPRYAHAGATLVRLALPMDWRSDAKGANYLLNRLRRVAQLHPTLRFAAVKPDAQLAALAEHGVSDDAKAFSVTAVGAGGAKFAMEGSWSPTDSATLEAWLQRLEGGLLEPFVKSEPVPSGLDNGVTVAVGKTFDATVLDEKKDVLIEFYAPWCGHCKTLAPKYEELAQALAHVDTLTVAKMDATANEWSHKEVYEVKGFPTLYFKPAGKAAMAYDGAREPGAMAEWMAAQATHKFTVPPSLKAAGGAPKKKASKKAKKAEVEF